MPLAILLFVLSKCCTKQANSTFPEVLISILFALQLFSSINEIKYFISKIMTIFLARTYLHDKLSTSWHSFF